MRKSLTIIAASLLVLAIFAGCGKKEETPAETNGGETPDAVTTASIVDSAQAVVDGLGAEGSWIVATLNDITVDEEIVVEGLFYNNDDTTGDIYRKLGLYTQDEDRNITASFSLTAPKMTVRSENFRIQGGTFVGDVHVEANGFEVGPSATVDGNVYFATQEYMDSASVHETGSVTGSMEVQ
ncbi:hypothetical protein [Anaerotalea alkaliphila]|uniref:Polymer-forming cytoskeletal protein n=1 Tax=Anaerotalea alkaliphila TaxID=2662126 RepID=A0A7X5HWC7_9FIRM|nr:hypothetical protein [Anaerotalea alkaliphila]NDL67868.1 hypothetical protein [Anaerotalea alkaliphila]